MHIFVKFMKNERSTKFYSIFQEVMKLRSLEGFDVSGVILGNAHIMSFSVVYNVLEQELIWFGNLENTLRFFFVPF